MGGSEGALPTLLRLLKAAGYQLRMHLEPTTTTTGSWPPSAPAGPPRSSAVGDNQPRAHRGWQRHPGRPKATVSGFGPVRVIEILADHGVEFVIIEGFAAALHGAPIPATQDVDVTPARRPRT